MVSGSWARRCRSRSRARSSSRKKLPTPQAPDQGQYILFSIICDEMTTGAGFNPAPAVISSQIMENRHIVLIVLDALILSNNLSRGSSYQQCQLSYVVQHQLMWRRWPRYELPF